MRFLTIKLIMFRQFTMTSRILLQRILEPTITRKLGHPGQAPLPLPLLLSSITPGVLQTVPEIISTSPSWAKVDFRMRVVSSSRILSRRTRFLTLGLFSTPS